MRSLLEYFLLTTTTLFFARTLGSRILYQEETSLNDTNANVNIICDSPASVISGQATTLHCVHAALQFPQSTAAGCFHSFGAYDGYHLPQLEYYESCKVRVRLYGTRAAWSTWKTIVQVASRIAVRCEVGPFPHSMTGGHAYLGEDRLIEVYVGKYEGVATGSGNSTINGATS